MAPAVRPPRKPAVPAPLKVRKPQAASLKPAKKLASVAIVRAINYNFSRGRYPWDDFQDESVVNSVELAYPDYPTPPVGVDHYLQQLSQQKFEYKHICSHPDEYRKLPDDMSDPDDASESEDESEDDGGDTDTGIDYTQTPDPPARVQDYDHTIYRAKTSNPAVFLAIVRVAQKNLPFLDFVSALSHLPNLPVDAPLPKLPKGTFPEDIPHEAQPTDTSLHLAFLPHFYADDRHALGYYQLQHTASDSKPTLLTCLFTPCTTADLVQHNLVVFHAGCYAVIENMQVVGCRKGEWLHVDVVEEWEARKDCVIVVGRDWQDRLCLYMGGDEDGGRREG